MDHLTVRSRSITAFLFLYLSASVLWPYCILNEIANADMLLMHSEEYMTSSWLVRDRTCSVKWRPQYFNGLLQSLGPTPESHANLYLYSPSNIIEPILHCNWPTKTGTIMQSCVKLSVLTLMLPCAAKDICIKAHGEKFKEKLKNADSLNQGTRMS